MTWEIQYLPNSNKNQEHMYEKRISILCTVFLYWILRASTGKNRNQNKKQNHNQKKPQKQQQQEKADHKALL